MLNLTPESHVRVARDLCGHAETYAGCRIMGFGGGGCNRRNLAVAWNGVLPRFLEA
jgi:acetoin utilization deacetylase AcuC-like enzyme